MRDVIEKSLKKITKTEEISLEFPENEAFGDYTTNVAMTSFDPKKLDFKNPREYAQWLVGELEKDDSLKGVVEKTQVAGGGFINFWLSQEFLVGQTKGVLKGDFPQKDVGRGKTVVIDYSSPNIAKRFGIGHLRSTIIGQALYEMFSFLGYKVIGDNHLGDWGTQFGTLLYQITEKKLNAKKLTIEELEELYVDFHKKAEEDPKLIEGARDWFKKLEEGDAEAVKIWKEMVELSRKEFEKVYDILGVKFDYAYGESFYQNKMPGVIEELKEKGLLIKSQGAQIVEIKGLPPAMAVKSDGTTTYFTRDLATVKYRLETWDPDIFVYEVGSDQTLYFRQLFEIVKLLGWAEGKQFVHLAHGLIRFEHGKMSTRKGKTIRLEEVLNQAVVRAREIIDRQKEGESKLKEEEKDEVARAVGIGAVKYFDLLHHPSTDIIFDWGKIFVLEGNSAPYIQYTIARTNSLVEKSTKSADFEQVALDTKMNDEEKALVRSVVKFPEVVLACTRSFSPNLLCNWLFDLSRKFNLFYNKHRIVGSENEEFRIALTKAVGQTLGKGLALLGIETPERM